MIRPGGFRGAAFGSADEGDPRHDASIRTALSTELGIQDEWAIVRQVHGANVRVATEPGYLGEADAIVSTVPGLPVVIATADCIPIVVEGEGGVAVIHAGWRGVVSGVVEATLAEMRGAGVEPHRAAIGPGIGPCCYEIGPEVAEQFGDRVSHTEWGATSVDLPGAVADALEDLVTWRSDACTYTDGAYHSHRRDRTPERQVTVGWLPRD